MQPTNQYAQEKVAVNSLVPVPTKVAEGNASAPVPTLPIDVVEGMRKAAQMDMTGQSSNDPIAGTGHSIRNISGAAVCVSSPQHGAEEFCKTRGTGDIPGMGRSIVGRDAHAAVFGNDPFAGAVVSIIQEDVLQAPGDPSGHSTTRANLSAGINDMPSLPYPAQVALMEGSREVKRSNPGLIGGFRAGTTPRFQGASPNSGATTPDGVSTKWNRLGTGH